MDEIIIRHIPTPAGGMILGSIGDALCLSDWSLSHRRQSTDRRISHLLGSTFRIGTSPVIEHAISELEEYFAGKRREFDITLRLCGTEFQTRVWRALTCIPYGTTTTYAALAASIGRSGSSRAVANAVGANPVSIILPCHRVIGSDGSLTGYAGGLPAKRLLLSLETT
ncbi:MAG: methylated-DNA--[protein]-cysteine S-methyltransferase [Muribaculaceae bacterium]|nr:methylated-DNA--[protein]-cysteine S-methyltransferase [Muribaculaceae bacterium]